MADIKKYIADFEKNILDLEKIQTAEERKVGFKTKAQTENLDELRAVKEQISLMKSFAEQYDRVGIEILKSIVSALVLMKFKDEWIKENSIWANLMQEVILLCEKLSDEEIKDPDKIYKKFFNF